MAVVGYFVLQRLGYDVNWNYWDDRKVACQEKIAECRKDLIKTGIEGAKENCNFNCVDPKLLIEKVKTTP
jgi:hypothetical protein